MNDQQINTLQIKLDYVFKDPSLLSAALTHSSYANENAKKKLLSNERLEFLGDSVLGMVIAVLIYDSRPDLPEGQMTRQRAELVCEKSLASLAKELELGEYILLGRGEEKGGGRNRPSILADAFEAVLAAVYLDGGFIPAKNLVSRYFTTHLSQPVLSNTDYKTSLQEIVQVKPGQTLIYKLIDEQGPDHDKTFTVEAVLNDKPISVGIGRSKKIAEQKAAQVAVEKLSVKK